MPIKWKTLAKGFIWEFIGGTLLFFIAWYTTGSAVGGSATSIVYGVVRAIMFYPYERTFKYVVRWYAERQRKGYLVCDDLGEPPWPEAPPIAGGYSAYIPSDRVIEEFEIVDEETNPEPITPLDVDKQERKVREVCEQVRIAAKEARDERIRKLDDKDGDK